MSSSKKMKAILGGPSYRMEVDARHAVCMARLAVLIRTSPQFDGLEFMYQHATPVEIARNELFSRALSTKATHLFWMDSDVYWEGDSEDDRSLLWGFSYLKNMQMPVLICPVRQRNGVCNIILDSSFTRPGGALEVGAGPVKDCWGGGLGMAIFNLEWYREQAVSQRWGSDGNPWFRSHWLTINGQEQFISEDIWHTSRLQKFKSTAQWCPLVYTRHADRGHDRS